MAEKEEIVTKEENKAAEQPPVEKKKGNKTIIMTGIVILISVGCAFVFVSKVYPSLTGNVAPDALVPENEASGETAEAQTVKQQETKKRRNSSHLLPEVMSGRLQRIISRTVCQTRICMICLLLFSLRN